MKKQLFSLPFLALVPVVLIAQPTISNNEFYRSGDVIQMVNCDATTLTAGSSGAAVTWDFSAAHSLGSFSTTSVTTNTSPDFITCNLALALPNGDTEYMQESSTDSYVDGILEHSGTLVDYNSYDVSKRSFTYNSVYVDTYYVTIPTISTRGKGYITMTGDAYGTLILPTGTYNNVLRIRKYQNELDTIAGGGLSIIITTSYLWFDGIHTAPLLQMDSINSASETSNDVMYLSVPAGIPSQNQAGFNFSGSFMYNDLVLNGEFLNGSDYDLIMYNVTGSVIYKDEFAALGNVQRFNMGAQIIPGIYLVAVTQKGVPSTQRVVCVLK